MAAKNSIWFNGQEYRWNESQHDYVHYGDGRTTYSDAKVRYAATGAQGVQGVQGVQGIEGVKGVQGVKGIQGAKPTIWYNGYEYEYDEQDGEYVRWARVGDKSKKFTLKEAKAKDKQKEGDDESSPLLFKGLSSSNEDLQKYAEHLKSLAKTEDVQKEQKELFAHITKLCDQWVDENKGKFSSTEEFEANRNQAFSKIGLACSSFLETINSEIKNRKEKKDELKAPPFVHKGFTNSPDDLEKYKKYLEGLSSSDLWKEEKLIETSWYTLYQDMEKKYKDKVTEEEFKTLDKKLGGQTWEFYDLVTDEIERRKTPRQKALEKYYGLFVYNGFPPFNKKKMELYAESLKTKTKEELKNEYSNINASYDEECKTWAAEAKKICDPQTVVDIYNKEIVPRRNEAFHKFEEVIESEIESRLHTANRMIRNLQFRNYYGLDDFYLGLYKNNLKRLTDQKDLEDELKSLPHDFAKIKAMWNIGDRSTLPIELQDEYQETVFGRVDEFQKKFEDAVNNEIVRRQKKEELKRQQKKRTYSLKKNEPYVPDVSFFPESASGIEVVKSDIGGSTGAKLVKDANGNHFIMKYGNSAEHIVNEAHADAFYQAAGAKVPGFKLYTDDNGKPVKLASEIKDATNFKDWWGSATEEERDDMRKKILKDFAVDVLVGNWDFIGDWDSNILVDSEGNPWRIDNGCSFGFRGQGDRKKDAEWNGFVDDLFTMTGNSAVIGSSVDSTIQKYLGTVRPLDVALEIASRDWSQALDTLPEEERDVVERRLVEMYQLAERGAENERFGRTAESTDEVIAFSYQMSKDGLREALDMKIELDKNNLAKWKDKAGWFKDGNETKTLNGKDYGSFGEYLAEKMGGEGFNYITNANEDQGDDSYNLDSVSRKLCILKSQGFDCTDPKYQTFDDFADDLEDAGYFYGVTTTQIEHFRQEFNTARNNPDAFKRRCKAANQYDAAIQLILENVEMENVDPKTRTFILFRREGYGVVRDESGNTPMPGERTFHKTGVCESHSRVRPIKFKDYATAVRVPFSRVHGLWIIERAFIEAGVFEPKHKTQFAGESENESVADSHGLVIVYGGDGADIPTSLHHLVQYEHDHPDEVVTGALFNDKNQET